MDFEYVKVIKSDLDDIDEAVSFILGKLSSVIRDEELMFNIRIVINEIVINSYEHGNKCNKEKGINLKVCVNMDCIHINVKDEGDGINYIFNENKDIKFNIIDTLLFFCYNELSFAPMVELVDTLVSGTSA